MLTQRLGSVTQKDPAFIHALLAEIEKHSGCCDEVWLATDYGFPEPKVHLESAATLAGVAKKFREAGIRVSLQISNTIGHGQYMSARDCSGLVYEGSNVERLVGPDGTAADYCFCWRGENLRAYVLAEVRAYAGAIKPHCVWVDDDLRATNHNPLSEGCFCDACMRAFNEKNGSSFSREELAREINYGSVIWRERFIDFVREGLYGFTYEISKAVHEVSPDSFMGLQYCAHGSYTGYGYEFIFGAMKKATGKNPKSRPGGGAYNDHNPGDMLAKSVYLSWQNSMLPEYVTEIRPEIENLPDVVFGKSIAGTCYETSLYLASGANAMSYAMLMNDFEPMEWHGEMLRAFSEHRAYWAKLAKSNEGTEQAGLSNVVSKNLWRRDITGERPFSWNYEPYAAGTGLIRCAVPTAFGRAKDPCYILHGQNAAYLTDDEVEFLLDKPVLTDGETLYSLSRRGYVFGAEAFPVKTDQLFEVFAPHAVNSGFEGRSWSQSHFVKEGYALCDTGGSTEVFGFYDTGSKNAPVFDPEGKYPYGVANAVVTTQRGAKWAVFGARPWNNVISIDKRNQILNAADYISGNRVPAILESRMQAVLLPRETPYGRVKSVSVVNCEIGRAKGARLRIRRPAGSRFIFMSQHCGESVLKADFSGDEAMVELLPLEPWSVGTVFID